MLAKLITHPHDKRLPQGSPSSPAIANLVAYELDNFVSEATKDLPNASSFRYSRYADDLVIYSSRDADSDTQKTLIELLTTGIESMGWQVATEKTKRWRASERRPLELCGILVPRHSGWRLGLPREVRRRLRSAKHHARVNALMPEDIGLLSYAYAITGAHHLRVHASQTTHEYVDQIATAMVPAEFREVFWQGWMDA